VPKLNDKKKLQQISAWGSWKLCVLNTQQPHKSHENFSPVVKKAFLFCPTKKIIEFIFIIHFLEHLLLSWFLIFSLFLSRRVETSEKQKSTHVLVLPIFTFNLKCDPICTSAAEFITMLFLYSGIVARNLSKYSYVSLIEKVLNSVWKLSPFSQCLENVNLPETCLSCICSWYQLFGNLMHDREWFQKSGEEVKMEQTCWINFVFWLRCRLKIETDFFSNSTNFKKRKHIEVITFDYW
jgi:hypothetical protein